jgi:hypothetical protein
MAAGAVLAALGATEFVGVDPATAEAAASPFAGSYTGEIRYGGGCTELCFKPYWILSVTISNSGKVTGVANYFENVFWGVYQSPAGDGSVSGSIGDGGKLRLTVKEGSHSEKFSGQTTGGANGEIYASNSSGLGAYLALIPQ